MKRFEMDKYSVSGWSVGGHYMCVVYCYDSYKITDAAIKLKKV